MVWLVEVTMTECRNYAVQMVWVSDKTTTWKGLDPSNIVCEYEVNPLTFDKVITEI